MGDPSGASFGSIGGGLIPSDVADFNLIFSSLGSDDSHKQSSQPLVSKKEKNDKKRKNATGGQPGLFASSTPETIAVPKKKKPFPEDPRQVQILRDSVSEYLIRHPDQALGRDADFFLECARDYSRSTGRTCVSWKHLIYQGVRLGWWTTQKSAKHAQLKSRSAKSAESRKNIFRDILGE